MSFLVLDSAHESGTQDTELAHGVQSDLFVISEVDLEGNGSMKKWHNLVVVSIQNN